MSPSQYPKRRLSVRSRKVSKPRDLYLELSDRSEIWQALRQQCCRCACQISERYDNSKYKSRGFETLRDLTERRLFGYWDGVLSSFLTTNPCWLSLLVFFRPIIDLPGIELNHEIILKSRPLFSLCHWNYSETTTPLFSLTLSLFVYMSVYIWFSSLVVVYDHDEWKWC